MNILAFDTGLNKTYLALSINDKIYSEVIESTKEKYHSAFLLEHMVKLLNQHNLRMQDINLVATNVGPGSFTGIRVGLTVARGIAQGINADAVGINSLELISNTYSDNAITILDARKNKAYVGNSKNVELLELEHLSDKLANYNGMIISDTKMCEFLKEKGIESVNFENDTPDIAATLIKSAIEKYNNCKYTKWQGLKPLYIQPPPIHKK